MRMSARLAMRANGLSYQEIGALLRDLRLEQGVVARALEFIMLTACLMSEASQAVWSEFDFQARVWTIPAERSKSGRAHRIPLSDQALVLLEQVRGCDPTWVFPGVGNARAGYPAPRGLLERLGYPAFATRASRTTFRNWAGERPQYSGAVVALCLGHYVEPAVPLIATRHPDRVEACRALMGDWARWCADRSETVSQTR
jgi:integrase